VAYNRRNSILCAEMYTCCPICKTNFNVTEAQLQVAQGKVRCGSCKNVFNARQHIFYQPIPPATVKPAVSKTKPNSDSFRETKQKNVSETSPLTRNKSNYQKATREIKPKPVTKVIPPEPDSSALEKKQTSSAKKPEEDLNIDAIFNALDTQLSQGTYIDIAKSNEVDIREAAFDEIFDENDILNENKEALVADTDVLKSTKRTSDHSIDLDVFSENQLEDNLNLNSSKETSNEELNTVPDKIPNKTSSEISIEIPIKIPNEIPNQIQAKEALEESEDNIQQHTFDFVSLPDEPTISAEDKKQLNSVSKPQDTIPKDQQTPQKDHIALHQAIDNIIKVENNIPTPFEEIDDHHFVIDVESEPDVALVDEDDIDKLFASTDSLKLSDLKFDNYKSTKEKEEHILSVIQEKMDAETEEPPEPEFKIEIDDDDKESFNHQVEKNVNPDSFSSDSLIMENFNSEDFNTKNLDSEKTIADDFALETELETGELEDDFDGEEIVLSSPDEEEFVPHRLRKAVASLEQQPISFRKRLLYSVAVLSLIALLTFQLVLFKSPAIANALPALQPLLVSMCESLPCRYTGSHNNKLVKILNRDVRLHPKIKGALLISATIMNQADFTQPYPTILLKFTDLSGATVAQRYFKPKEYLGLLNKPFALMPSKKPVQLNIELLDPGSDAINFQFFFL